MESDDSLLLDCGVSVERGIAHLKQRKPQVLFTNFTEEYQHVNKSASTVSLEEIQGAMIADCRESDDACRPTHFFDVNPAPSQEKTGKTNGFATLLH